MSALPASAPGQPVTAGHRPGERPDYARAAAHGDDPLIERAWNALEAVPDPEIPVVSIRELGILRDVRKKRKSE